MVRSGKATKSKVVTKGMVRSMVKSMLAHETELKTWDTTVGTTSTVAGQISPISQGIIQGNALNQRLGDTIVTKQLEIRLVLDSTAASAALRCIAFVDHLNTGTLPAATDVLDTANNLSSLNLINLEAGRFSILLDKVFSFSPGGPSVHTPTYKYKLNYKTIFNATTNVSGNNGKNSLFLLFIGNNTAVTIGAGFTVRYTDA